MKVFWPILLLPLHAVADAYTILVAVSDSRRGPSVAHLIELRDGCSLHVTKIGKPVCDLDPDKSQNIIPPKYKSQRSSIASSFRRLSHRLLSDSERYVPDPTNRSTTNEQSKKTQKTKKTKKTITNRPATSSDADDTSNKNTEVMPALQCTEGHGCRLSDSVDHDVSTINVLVPTSTQITSTQIPIRQIPSKDKMQKFAIFTYDHYVLYMTIGTKETLVDIRFYLSGNRKLTEIPMVGCFGCKRRPIYKVAKGGFSRNDAMKSGPRIGFPFPSDDRYYYLDIVIGEGVKYTKKHNSSHICLYKDEENGELIICTNDAVISIVGGSAVEGVAAAGITGRPPYFNTYALVKGKPAEVYLHPNCILEFDSISKKLICRRVVDKKPTQKIDKKLTKKIDKNSNVLTQKYRRSSRTICAGLDPHSFQSMTCTPGIGCTLDAEDSFSATFTVYFKKGAITHLTRQNGKHHTHPTTVLMMLNEVFVLLNNSSEIDLKLEYQDAVHTVTACIRCKYVPVYLVNAEGVHKQDSVKYYPRVPPRHNLEYVVPFPESTTFGDDLKRPAAYFLHPSNSRLNLGIIDIHPGFDLHIKPYDDLDKMMIYRW